MTEAAWLTVGKQCVPDISNSSDKLYEWQRLGTAVKAESCKTKSIVDGKSGFDSICKDVA